MITPTQLKEAVKQAREANVVRDLKKRDLEMQATQSQVGPKNPTEVRTYIGDNPSGPINVGYEHSRMAF